MSKVVGYENFYKSNMQYLVIIQNHFSTDSTSKEKLKMRNSGLLSMFQSSKLHDMKKKVRIHK